MTELKPLLKGKISGLNGVVLGQDGVCMKTGRPRSEKTVAQKPADFSTWWTLVGSFTV